jgi:hypothetical protein
MGTRRSFGLRGLDANALGLGSVDHQHWQGLLAAPKCASGIRNRSCSLQQIWSLPAIHARILESPLDGHELVDEDRSGGDCAGIVEEA